MRDFFASSLFFGMLLTFVCYQLGLYCKRKFKLAIFNPMLIAIVSIILILLIFDIDYEFYNSSAQNLTYLLTPTTICLAIPLYEQIEKLKKNSFAVLGGILAGVVTNLVVVLGMSVFFKLPRNIYVTMLPKSITSAIAVPLCEEYGGIVAITVAAITVTGILGSVFAETACRLFKITEPIARGIAIGTCSHAAGTSKAMELGEVEGAMSSLAIAVAGIMTVIIAPFFMGFY